MPEEVNRIVTDRVSDFLFTPSADGNENLRAEGVPGSHVFLVGNIMIDSLVASIPEVERSTVLARLGLQPRSYGVLTLHRPSNVDDLEQLADILASLATIQEAVRFVFPVHPRTREMLARFGDSNPLDRMPNVVVTAPLGYRDFLRLERDAAFVMTDSGGIQEESTFLGIPCLTLRENTERPITTSDGTNLLIGRDGKRLVAEVRKILAGGGKTGRVPPLWDGRTAERIVEVLRAHRRGDLPKRPWGPTPPGAAGGARRVG
jgi:UDP-N-acetylglucosamine 2-epimerase (non-hydrolysing)